MDDCRRMQTGQALAEALVVTGVLASLWLAVVWLGRLQDIDLQLLHASRRAAFAFAHQGVSAEALAADTALELSAPGQRWQTRRGQSFLAEAAQVGLQATAVVPLREPGDVVPDTGALRAELQLGDAAVWRAGAVVRTSGQDQAATRLQDFDRQALSWQRQTAIMRGSGAASDDVAVQSVLAGSPHAWGRWAQASIREGQVLDLRLQGVDAAWGRARPDWDWLQPWAGDVPEHHLSARTTP
ncbi:hypothetical protein [Castellaniella sp.]|uniref:hypothetical protein n=1 Tax=Castellaniella sp. TaxID=1955812 RepID=UPI002AFE9043|nr:hypothetical protein [Castellaniella sp.]